MCCVCVCVCVCERERECLCVSLCVEIKHIGIEINMYLLQHMPATSGTYRTDTPLTRSSRLNLGRQGLKFGVSLLRQGLQKRCLPGGRLCVVWSAC